jgi:hypothetical protein
VLGSAAWPVKAEMICYGTNKLPFGLVPRPSPRAHRQMPTMVRPRGSGSLRHARASSADHTSRRRLEMVMSAREDFGVTCEITGLVGVHASDLAEPDFGWAWNRLS